MLLQQMVVRFLVGGCQAEEMCVRTHSAEKGELQGRSPGLCDCQRCVAGGIRRCPFAEPAADMADDDLHAVVAAGGGIDQPGRLRGGPVDRAVGAHGEQVATGGIKRHAGALGRAGIGEMHADAGAQLIDIDRLGQIVDTTGFQRPHHMFGLRQPGHEDDRHLRHGGIGLQAAAGLETVHSRHDGVEQDDIGCDAFGDVERGLTRGGDQRRKA
ncbi:hypothetical protein D3C86_1522150 [compost metagenome]